jgi:hypothetical protein
VAAEYALWINNQGDNINDSLGNRLVFALYSPPPLPAIIVRGFTHIETSAHVRFEAYPHFALDPLAALTVGHLRGVLDMASGVNEPVQLHVWKPARVFRIETSKVAGGAFAGPGMMLYVTPAAELTLESGGGDNALLGTITAADGAISFILAIK